MILRVRKREGGEKKNRLLEGIPQKRSCVFFFSRKKGEKKELPEEDGSPESFRGSCSRSLDRNEDTVYRVQRGNRMLHRAYLSYPFAPMRFRANEENAGVRVLEQETPLGLRGNADLGRLSCREKVPRH